MLPFSHLRNLLGSFEPRRFRKVSICLVEVALLEIGVSATSVGRGIVWVKLDRLVEVTNRLVQVALVGIG